MSKLKEWENTLQCMDCLKGMKQLPDGCVDLVVTDPPYSKEFIFLYGELSRACSRLLRDGKFLITYAGHYHLPEILLELAKHMKYYWLFCLRHQAGASKMIFEKRISCHFKPILAFIKGKQNEDYPIISDVIKGSGRSKNNHPWEQGVSELGTFIQTYTLEGDLILDPFAGSGTTLVACKQLNRRFIGFDNDPKCVDIANERLKQEVFNYD